MKTWIKATIVALLAIFSTSCTFEYNDDNDYDRSFYLFYGKTWSEIIESPGYNYFVCYEFYKDGDYTYWFYERNGSQMFSIENGRWEVITHGGEDEIRLYSNGRIDTYYIDDFLDGLCDHNSRFDIDDYKILIDDLYRHY